ncbi:hypothetical protein [Kitasatospora sp. NPDC056181]|uniref:hypothetical protein n=1 Tax=Kitasatospora sp. NPDC056181 TaxID=3345737 RepID=UPI0035E26A54
MGMYTSATLIYGTQIPDTSLDELEERLGTLSNGVGYVTAGHYDHDKTYLAAFTESADLGKPEAITADRLHPAQCQHWDAHLREAATALGITDDIAPTWLLIADVS